MGHVEGAFSVRVLLRVAQFEAVSAHHGSFVWALLRQRTALLRIEGDPAFEKLTCLILKCIDTFGGRDPVERVWPRTL